MKKKHIWHRLLAIMVLLTPMLQVLANNQTALKLVMNNGTTASFLLSEQPVLSFESHLLVVSSNTVSASYQLSDVKEYYFVELGNSVEELQKDEVRFVRQSNDEVIIYGLSPSVVCVYDLSGRRRPVSIQQQGNAVVVSLQQLQAATYIIHLNQQSIKIIKK